METFLAFINTLPPLLMKVEFYVAILSILVILLCISTAMHNRKAAQINKKLDDLLKRQPRNER